MSSAEEEDLLDLLYLGMSRDFDVDFHSFLDQTESTCYNWYYCGFHTTHFFQFLFLGFYIWRVFFCSFQEGVSFSGDRHVNQQSSSILFVHHYYIMYSFFLSVCFGMSCCIVSPSFSVTVSVSLLFFTMSCRVFARLLAVILGLDVGFFVVRVCGEQ